MKRSDYFILCLVILGTVFFVGVSDSLAKADLALTVSDVTFSKEAALAGEKTRIFAPAA